MRITVQLIKCHTRQAIPCVVVTIESQKYFFNLYESFQRFYRQHSVKFLRGNKIFFTQITGDHINGMFGLVLTFQEKGLAENVQIFGPPGLSNYIDSVRSLIGNRLLAYSVYDFCSNGQKVLGFLSEKFMNETIARKDYGKLFFKMDEFLAQEQKKDPSLINDAESYIKGGSYYKDGFTEIHPVLLAPVNMIETMKPSLCYIVKPDKIPGRVNAGKLKEFGIQPKFIGKLLEAGELEINGTVYKAQDFKEPDLASPLCIIVDCPTEAHMEILINEPKMKRLFATAIDPKEEEVKTMVHIVPSNVLMNPKYAKFLENFHPSCQHIFANEDIKETKISLNISQGKEGKQKKDKDQQSIVPDKTVVNYKHFLLSTILSKYFPDHFPRLEDLELKAKYDLNGLFPLLANKNSYQKMVELVLAPKKNEGFVPVGLLADDTAKLLNFAENDAFLKKYKKWLQKLKEPITENDVETLKLFKHCDPELVFLGTQSMMPSTYCNVSGMYLRFWQQGNIGFLLDCGEGSYIQLIHHYGPEKTREILKNTAVIYITHIHADHHVGFLQLIKERDRILQEENIEGNPVYLIIPFNCTAWVAKYLKVVDNLNYRIIFNQHIKIENGKVETDMHMKQAPGGILLQEREVEQQEQEETKTNSPEEESKKEAAEEEEYEFYEDPDLLKYLEEEEKKSLSNVPVFEEFLRTRVGITKFKSVDVDHCPQAYGVYIEHKDGWRFVYSGDTKPCNIMVEEVENTTILVHESTFGEDLKHMAAVRLHSTDKEAMEMGIKLKAWRTILTHFSQRYVGQLNRQSDKMQLGGMLYKYSKDNVVRALDHLYFRFSQLVKLPMLSGCIGAMSFENL